MATIPVLHTLEHEVVVVGEAEEGEDDLPEEVQHGGHHAQQPEAQHHLLLELSTNHEPSWSLKFGKQRPLNCPPAMTFADKRPKFTEFTVFKPENTV